MEFSASVQGTEAALSSHVLYKPPYENVAAQNDETQFKKGIYRRGSSLDAGGSCPSYQPSTGSHGMRRSLHGAPSFKGDPASQARYRDLGYYFDRLEWHGSHQRHE